jgi:DNA-binding response OmpR family regulator
MTSILLVEDAAELSRIIQHELESAGFQVHHASDGLSALDLFQECSPDLVILDWMLPKMGGLEVLRRLRTFSPVPVLMLTAKSEEIDRKMGLEVGADDYLTKPFSMRELVARARALVRRTERIRQILFSDRGAGRESLQQAGLTLNPNTFEVVLDDEPLELTRTEFTLLYLFLRNPGRVFNRTFLLEAVWGEPYIEGDRSVDNTILRLRKKMGHFGETIETVWGIGYRFKQDR